MTTRVWLQVFATGGLLFAASSAHAVGGDVRNLFRSSADGKIIRCESRGMEEKLCPANVVGGVALHAQRSKTPCIEGRNWRSTPEGIRVSLGCRADFVVGRKKPEYTSRVITCESPNQRWAFCAVDTSAGVRMVRQLSSDTPCVRNQTWGIRDQGIWVASGCRGEFKVGEDQEDRESVSAIKLTRCESENGTRRRCRLDTGKGVRLLKPLSSSPCNFGSTWGYDDSEIWVRRGCRADFEIDVDPVAVSESVTIPEDAELVRCESENEQVARCPVKSKGGNIQVKAQRSRKQCEQGKNWRLEANQIVVSGGCRAVFAAW